MKTPLRLLGGCLFPLLRLGVVLPVGHRRLRIPLRMVVATGGGGDIFAYVRRKIIQSLLEKMRVAEHVTFPLLQISKQIAFLI